jgi:hypothetical protein
LAEESPADKEDEVRELGAKDGVPTGLPTLDIGLVKEA